MARDPERIERLQAGLKEAGLDAIVCALPSNVLLLTGYYPMTGRSIAVATRDGELLLLVPEDEKELAESNADLVIILRSSTLGEVHRHLVDHFHLNGKIVGCECGACCQPASYVSMHFYGDAICKALEGAHVRRADEFLKRMKAVLTPIELDRICRACRIAEIAFRRGAAALAPGLKETEAADQFQRHLTSVGIGFEGVDRAGGSVFCMSGANSAKAWAAYARSHARALEIGDLALVHCNSHAGGYWTDITRTYCFQPVSDFQYRMYEFVFEARRAAFDRIAPGIRAADVDGAAREIMRSHSVAESFKHSTGHGVGFAAADHDALPRLAPDSPDLLESGMVLNIEPALYFDGVGGVRHCDIVQVTENGAQWLTPFHYRLDDLLH